MVKKEIKVKNKGNNTVGTSNHATPNAITLIALIITIILLLILAGVTLSLVIGKSGILNGSKQATDEHIKQEATEAMNLKITAIQMKSYTETQQLPNLQYLANNLCEDNDMEYVRKKETEVASLDKINVKDVTSIFTKMWKYPYEFEIDSSLRLASINGVKLADNDNTNILERLENMELAIKNLQEENKSLKSANEELTTRINKLENEKTSITREKLTKSNYIASDIPTVLNITDRSIEIELSSSIENYKYLEFQVDIRNASGYTGHKTILLSTENLKYNSTNNLDWYNDTIFYLSLEWGGVASSIGCYFKNQNTLRVCSSLSSYSDWQAFRITNIYGIK